MLLGEQQSIILASNLIEDKRLRTACHPKQTPLGLHQAPGSGDRVDKIETTVTFLSCRSTI